MSKERDFSVAQDKSLEADLAEIKYKLMYVTDKVSEHLLADKNDHILVRKSLEFYNQKQEKIEDRVVEFFGGISDLKDELHEMSAQLSSYNHHLVDHVAKSDNNASKVASMEQRFLELSEKQTDALLEIQKLTTAAKTIVQVFSGICATLGAAWVVMQIFYKLSGS